MDAQQIVDVVFLALGIVPAKPHPGDKVSPHLTVGQDELTSVDTNEMYLMPEIVRLFETARIAYGAPIKVNAGFRTVAREAWLAARGNYTAALLSAHSLGAALDCAADDNDKLRQHFLDAATRLGYKTPRLGWRAYDNKIVHVDLAFMLFKPFTLLAHPMDWPTLDRQQRVSMGSFVPGASW